MKINVVLPKSWQELTQKQLRQLFQTIADVHDIIKADAFESQESYATVESAQIKSHCFFLWSGIEVVCRYADKFLVKYKKEEGILDPDVVVDAISSLDWIDSAQDFPVRINKIGNRICKFDILAAQISFENWLAMENLFLGFSNTSDPALLCRMIEMAYGKLNSKPADAEILSMFYWWAAVKNCAARSFPDFFSGSSDDDAGYDAIRKNIDCQLRALTKGDPTKEKDVLNLPAYRALAELDAQAREAKELDKIYGHSS